eukprot:TRINITY_DN2538_c0_g1_i6.p1 TRINITY_DN2538_c0_g1~~TRINITY_DN2538_c0_g1_i6.p1  ORF type:complete len:222 (-),score=64.41 TRINITY_DN2538_c0_g1_i6:377-1042(-)
MGRVNVNSEAMSEKMQREFDELQKRKKILSNDKQQLQDSMTDLEVKRRGDLEKCWKKVNENLGKIFGTLLPSASAKIQPIPGRDITEGLELSVAFNNVWKTSLSELSGGQRSLLALSFILALLQYKPAPFYILDEIDAALDLSHTENIGAMISRHFPQSQFIVISLKEGLYAHANTLFKTSFVNGISRVERFQLKNSAYQTKEARGRRDQLRDKTNEETHT